ncbi:class I SAM-dependent methyltransferase [Shewanella fodinae]|uniref:Ribosomal RNA small subunit methyltransferase C n=1 Tax=Shewanella fodinae TaxID=552357 RepID=A0A4R2FIV1_9GAMM|nr:class I SAM-dependent methyltransferase [Shewanella fodinae]MDN5368956.1 rRNA (guanine1207-N2)-methyltransferase [Shewanella sp.]TCN88868.1 16S rRNA m(2)G 1207 methyltransferase [Shewanella fodinae]
MLTAPSQLILRNSEHVRGKVLLLNHESDLCAVELQKDCDSVTALALDFNHYLALQVAGAKVTCYFGHQLPKPDTFDTVVIYYPKAKALMGYLLQLAAVYLSNGGQLLVVGENKGGIRAFDKQQSDHFSPARKRDNARHCLLYTAERNHTLAQLHIEPFLSRYQLSTANGTLTICNMVGVFSEKQLDQGTELLLQHLPSLNGRVLDFGCGAGVISAALLLQNPQLQLECVDINALALLACEHTLAANGFSARVYPSDGLAQVTGAFEGIISNPPFHDGLNSTTDIATSFVADSRRHLKSGGIWQIVANRHLPYADTIVRHFGEVNIIAETNKYKVYRNRT